MYCQRTDQRVQFKLVTTSSKLINLCIAGGFAEACVQTITKIYSQFKKLTGVPTKQWLGQSAIGKMSTSILRVHFGQRAVIDTPSKTGDGKLSPHGKKEIVMFFTLVTFAMTCVLLGTLSTCLLKVT